MCSGRKAEIDRNGMEIGSLRVAMGVGQLHVPTTYIGSLSCSNHALIIAQCVIRLHNIVLRACLVVEQG